MSNSSDDEHYDGLLDTPINVIEYEPVFWALIKALGVLYWRRMKKNKLYKYECHIHNVDDEDSDVLGQGFKKKDYTNHVIMSKIEIVGRKMLYTLSGYVTVNEKP